MKKRVALADDLELSRIAYGMWRLADDADQSPAHVQAKIEACLEQGITTFDQADIYGDYSSEEVFGGALKAAPELRDKIEIVTKCGIKLLSRKFPERRVKHYDTSAAHIELAVENSLRIMGIEQIDLLLIHRPDPFMDPEETGRALDVLVEKGKARRIGVSNFRPFDWTLLQSYMEQPLCTNQLELSLLANAAFSDGDLAFLQERRISPMAWSPLAGGALFSGASTDLLRAKMTPHAEANGVDISAIAIAWLLAHPANIMPVLGTNSMQRIKKLSEAYNVQLSREDWFELYETALGREVA